jgi:hypothetical protein
VGLSWHRRTPLLSDATPRVPDLELKRHRSVHWSSLVRHGFCHRTRTRTPTRNRFCACSSRHSALPQSWILSNPQAQEEIFLFDCSVFRFRRCIIVICLRVRVPPFGLSTSASTIGWRTNKLSGTVATMVQRAKREPSCPRPVSTPTKRSHGVASVLFSSPSSLSASSALSPSLF